MRRHDASMHDMQHVAQLVLRWPPLQILLENLQHHEQFETAFVFLQKVLRDLQDGVSAGVHPDR